MIWAGKEGPMFTDAAWEAADGDRREVDLPLNAVASAAQAQRIAAAYARDARRWRSHKVPLPPDAAVLEPLDVVAWTSARNGYVAKAFEVREIEDDPETMVQIVTLREVDPADYSWSTGEEQPVSLPSRRYVDPEVVGLKDWAVAAVSLPDQAGTPRRSGLVLSWDGVATTGAALVEYEIRVAGPGPLVASGTLRADTGTGRVDGLLPATSYDVRARVVTPRPANWTAWTPVTTGVDRLTSADLAQGAVTNNVVRINLDPLPSPWVLTPAAPSQSIGTIGAGSSFPVVGGRVVAELTLDLTAAAPRQLSVVIWNAGASKGGNILEQVIVLRPGAAFRVLSQETPQLTSSNLSSLTLTVTALDLLTGEQISVTGVKVIRQTHLA